MGRCKGSDGWIIRRFEGPHSCVAPTMTQEHRQLSYEVIVSCIIGIVRFDYFIYYPSFKNALSLYNFMQKDLEKEEKSN